MSVTIWAALDERERMMTRALVQHVAALAGDAQDLDAGAGLPADLAAYARAFGSWTGDVAVGELWLHAPRAQGDAKTLQIGMVASGAPILARVDEASYQIKVASFDGEETHASLEAMLIGAYFPLMERGQQLPFQAYLPADFETAFY